MNKQDLIAIVAEENELSKAQAGRVIDSVFDAIVESVAKGDGFQLIGFGSFKAVKRDAREGRNPANGETIKIPATTLPKFVAGAAFKAAVAKKKCCKKC
ncbi:MAG TPA: HU family DNA-binding protein [Candidatus Aphodousia gallistercoris]|nr:HU family DNA-binding protein [Candidatus Aphodousia gallistercoris]